MALAILLAMPATQLFAQNQKGAELSIGAEGALPIGSFKDSHKYGIGGTAKFAYNFDESVAVTLTSGYLHFSGKDGYSGGSLIPVKAGLRYTFPGGFYGEPQFGFTSISDGGGTGFTYAINLGYRTFPGVDVSARYEGISKNGTSSFIGIRIAYAFGLGAK